MRDITPLVAPRSIAVIGASANPSKSGGVLFDNLVKGKFHGPLYPINRTAARVVGKTGMLAPSRPAVQRCLASPP